jgi:hypothetical protein
MAEVAIPKEKMDYTIDLLITMTVEEIAKMTGKDCKEVLPEFLHSKTGKALYDKDNRLWWNGPTYLAELYAEETQDSPTYSPT